MPLNKKDLLKKKEEILSRVNIETEYALFGIEALAVPTNSGWVECRNPFKKDKHPSAGFNIGSSSYRGFIKMFNADGVEKDALSFWAMAYNFHPRVQGEEFFTILKFYADQTGVDLQSNQKPPTPEQVKYYQNQLNPDILKYLHEKRGLTDESIKKYEIGYSDKRKRISYPVYDKSGNLVNIRFHSIKKGVEPKVQGTKGFNQKRLWGIDRLAKVKPGQVVCLTEGEGDSQVVEQNLDVLSLSPTNGKEAFDPEWFTHLHGHHLVLLWDCDKDGREAVEKKILPALRTPVRNGQILSVKVVWLFNDPKNKDMKDATDYFTKANGTAEQLLQIIKETPPYDFSIKTPEAQPPKSLKSFDEIDYAENAGQRVTVPLFVFGENTEAYYAPSEVVVGECKGKKNGCAGRDDWDFPCDASIPIQPGSRVQLCAISSSETQLKGSLREYVCDKNQKPVIQIDEAKKTALREVYCHQVSTAMNASELIEKPVYIIGGDLLHIGQYQATGHVYANPRNQKPTMIIDQIESQEEDWQAFDLNSSLIHLKELQSVDFMHLVHDIAYEVTKIYERENLHIGTLLTLCSPTWINFPGDDIIRGWISSVIIGDSGTGKSTVTEKIFRYTGIGHRVSGMTSSRTGITYACEHDEKRGWRIKAGALPKMSGQSLIIDEAQDLEEEDLKTMAEALDSGMLQIDRVQSKSFKTETRCIFSCNPKPAHRNADQRTMASFRRGCTAVQSIFPKMMVRRLDLILPATSYDIKDKNLIHNAKRPDALKQVISPTNLRSLIFYAWNLKQDQINISDIVAKHIREAAGNLSDTFGQCEDLPIVYPEDFRKTMCRLCVSLAILDLSTEDDFETITVTHEHVELIESWIRDLYSGDNFQLDVHSGIRFKESKIDESDVDIIVDNLNNYIGFVSERKERIVESIKLLVSFPENEKQKISRRELSNLFDVDIRSVQRDMSELKKNGLIKIGHGYSATDKLFRFVNILRKKGEKGRQTGQSGHYYHFESLIG